VVVLGAGLDTFAYRLARKSDIPIFEVDQPVNIERKAAAVRRVLGELPSSVRLVSLNFERDNVLKVLTGHGIAMLDHLAGGDFTALPRLCQELVLAQRQLTPFTDVLFGPIAEAMC
jgi:hypothetical protein